jgi:hypothetical protein
VDRQKLIDDTIAANPQTSKIRLAKMLFAKHPDAFSTLNAAHLAVRRCTGTQGNLHRARLSKKGQTKHHGHKPIGSKIYCPPSKAKPWEPYTVNATCVAIFSDCHFPKHDAAAIEAAVEHVKEFGEPDVVLLNGDFADAEEFSSWAKSPKAIDTANSLEIIREGLLYFRRSFPDAKLIYKFGNHEERLERYCWSRAPELVGLDHISWKGLLTIDAELNKIDELAEVEFVGEQRPVMVGKLPVWHGHELPRGLQSSVNPARGAFLRMIDTSLIGHHHRSSSHVEYTWKHDPINCWSVGCLCHLNMDYARINKWNHGHAIVKVDSKGDFNVHNFKQIKGQVVTV